MTFYHKCLGGTLTIATAGDTYERPANPRHERLIP